MEQIYGILQTLRPEFDFKSSENFVDDGYLDSFDVISLVAELESVFQIQIDAMDILPENFSNIDSILNLVCKNGGKI